MILDHFNFFNNCSLYQMNIELKLRWDQRCLIFSFFKFYEKENNFQLLAFFSFDGFGGKMKMTAINDFVLATHFLQAEVEDSSHCLSSARLPRSAWCPWQAGRAAGDGSLWCLLQLLPYDPHGQRSWPARTDHWPETLLRSTVSMLCQCNRVFPYTRT